METIVAAAATYVLPIKGDNLRGVAAAKEIIGRRAPEQTYYTQETAHGRTNSWTVCAYMLENNAPGFQLYKDCQWLYSIYRTDSRYQKDTSIFYLSNHPFDTPQALLGQVRAYWNIENLLHYTRDVHFKQDKNRISDTNIAPMFAVFNTIAINLLRDKVGYSITDAMDWARSNQTKFADLVRM